MEPTNGRQHARDRGIRVALAGRVLVGTKRTQEVRDVGLLNVGRIRDIARAQVLQVEAEIAPIGGSRVRGDAAFYGEVVKEAFHLAGDPATGSKRCVGRRHGRLPFLDSDEGRVTRRTGSAVRGG